jgi:DNA-binding winged helix-turn-helix (wHTH) protein/TolB-like protein
VNVAMSAESNIDYGFERYCVDRRDERLIGPHGPIKLGNKAFQVLLKLIEQGGRLVTKDALMSSVWDGTIVSEFSLTSAIKELRRALGDDARAPRFIESVYGRGYRFLTPIDEIDDERRPAAGLHGVDRPSRAPLPVGSNDSAVPVDEPAGPSPARCESDRRPSIRFRSLRSNLVAAAILVSSSFALMPGWLDRVAGPGGAASAPGGSAAAAAQGEMRLAVLPFEDLSGARKSAPALRGLEEQVIDSLAGEPGLRVTGRTLASVLDDNAEDVRRTLGLTHLLEGSLRAEGDRVRVGIRLLRAEDGTSVWSERFDLPAGEASAMESRIGQAVAARVRARFRNAAA